MAIAQAVPALANPPREVIPEHAAEIVEDGAATAEEELQAYGTSRAIGCAEVPVADMIARASSRSMISPTPSAPDFEPSVTRKRGSTR